MMIIGRMWTKPLIFIFLFIIFNGCRSEYEKLKRSPDVAKKYEKAKEYYNKKDYFRALPLFEELVTIYRGTDEAETIYYYYAYCTYGMKDLLAARFHFKTFADTYPNSKYAEECRFMAAYCYYFESPTYSLDQENTYKAIESLQLFINLYPNSERVKESNDLIDKLRSKLELKSYEIAKLYYNIGDYKSAIISFRNSIDDFPDTKYREEMEYLMVKSSFLFAKNSVETKQIERYNETLKLFNTFAENYSNSDYIKDANNINRDALKELESKKKLSLN